LTSGANSDHLTVAALGGPRESSLCDAEVIMEPDTDTDINTDRIDEAVLALLWLGLHEDDRVWKSFDWEAMNRLHEKGFISDPVGKAKSVRLTEQGARRSEELFEQMFTRR
jgi:hypothetical protein